MSKIVKRTLDFLELFGRHRRPLTLSEISRLLDIPASSCHDALQTLQERGYVYELAPRAGYYPTLRMLELMRGVAETDPLLLRADAVLRSLRDQTDESVLLAKVSGQVGTWLLAVESTHPLRFSVTIGTNILSLHATSGGKIVMSTWSDEARAAYLNTAELTRLTPGTLTEPAALEAEIQLGRSRGWHANFEESETGVITISAPFAWASATYFVTIAGPTARIAPKLEKIAELLLEACQALETQSSF